jgi:hypothetical protein
MGIPCSTRNRERVLNSADIHLAWVRVISVPNTAEAFIDGSFVANLIFRN